jgi:lipopolysaccharide transport system ATP-binding protein
MADDIAIRVDGLSKLYKIGALRERHDTLRDQIAASVGGVFRRNGSGRDRGSDRLWALKDVSFEVPRGERIGIVGRNGAGKSTLLKILSRVTAPTEGRARVRGRVGALLEVGTGFHPELTGRENVFLNGMILGMSRREVERRYDEIVEFSEIGKFIDTPVKRYSSGMYVRLAFAVAAHLEPEVMIVDEVLAVGDHAFRQKCLGKMGEASSQGRTILFVSHDTHNVRRLCNRAIWLDHGRIREAGFSREVTFAYEAATVPTEQVGSGDFIRAAPADSEIWVERLELVDDEGTRRAEFDLGDAMTLRFTLGRREQMALDNVHVSWTISDEVGTRLTSGSTVHWDVAVSKDERVVECRLEELPFYQGRYKIEASIYHESVGRVDTWPEAGEFDIVYSAPTGTGFELNRLSGYVHVKHRWLIG